MRIGDLKKYLRLLPRTQSVLILGPPGCGKSKAVREFAEEEAEELNREFVEYDDDDETFAKIVQNPEKHYIFIDLRLSETEPTDLIGIPRDVDNYIIYKPLRWVKLFTNAKTAGLIFLDELTNVRRDDVLSQAYKLVLDRRIGYKKISPNVRVIAAGNDPQTSSIANLLPAPLTNRFLIFKIDETTIEEWINYVNEKEGGIDPRVAGYILRFPADLQQKPDHPETLENYPTPRGWSKLNTIIKGVTELEEIRQLATAALGEEVAVKFTAFCKLREYIPEPKEILDNPEILKKEYSNISRIDLIYYAVASVASFLNNNDVAEEKIIKFAKMLIEIQADLLIVFLKLISQKKRRQLQSALVEDETIRKFLVSIANYL